MRAFADSLGPVGLHWPPIARVLPLVPGLVLLAWHPAIWLAQSWFDDAYASDGEWVFGLCVVLIATGLLSERRAPTPSRDLRTAVGLEFGTALVRAVGELLAVRTVGALALVVDVYALGLGLGLKYRSRPRSPLGLALLLSLSLPVERLFQRGFGYPMQLWSARGACALLEPLHWDLTCHGTRIALADHALSVDLPCSGAQGLVLLSALSMALVALGRIRGRRIWLLAGLVPVCAYAANTLRLFLLAEGLVLGVDVISEPAHSLVGTACLVVCAWPLLLVVQAPRDVPRVPAGQTSLRTSSPWGVGLALLLGAVAVFLVPGRPVDVSGPVPPVRLPASIDRWRATELALAPKETEYFRAYGGVATKVKYWTEDEERVVLVVRTRAPLRHLHGPDECLVGAGHRVRLLGVRIADGTAVYRSVDPSGEAWRVEVSFFSDDGQRASNVAEVAWRWIQAPHTTWTMIQRISPWWRCQTQPQRCADFDRRLFHALED